MRTLLAFLLFSSFLGIPQDTTRLRWVPNPRAVSGSWVSDPARHLRAETITQINGIISALERETSTEIAVVVIDSLDGLEPSAAAFLLHRRWGVGKRARDNGIVLLWSPKLRRTHVSVGYGLEGVLTDSRAGRIQDEEIIPRFRRNEFDAGMVAGVQALAAAARRETYAGPERAHATSVEDRSGLYAILITVPVLTFAGLALARHRRRPRCPRGHGRMRRLSEAQDDKFIGEEAVLEEELGSMNYTVWLCGQCDYRKIVSGRRLFSSYERCPECKRRTVSVESNELVAATYSSKGKCQVTRTCENCQWTKTAVEVIPIRVKSTSESSGGWSSSSGGGGSSSFGGGSSGGGGAGRSY